jgi:flagellar biosynthesis GTPase FlhF
LAESILGLHVKYNGPLHPEFYKLLLPVKEGDRFVSFASMVFQFLSTAARAKSKYDSELKKYLPNIEDGCGLEIKNPLPPQNFFYSLKEMNASRVRKQVAKVQKSDELEKKKNSAKARKAKQRQLQKDEDAELKKTLCKQKKPRASRKKKAPEESEAEESPNEEDDAVSEEVAPKRSESS